MYSWCYPFILEPDEKTNPSEIFRTHIDDLCDAFAVHFDRIINGLFAKKLIGQSVLESATTEGVSNYCKASKLVHILYGLLLVHKDPDQYLVKICDVLLKQHDQVLTDIVISIRTD